VTVTVDPAAAPPAAPAPAPTAPSEAAPPTSTNSAQEQTQESNEAVDVVAGTAR